MRNNLFNDCRICSNVIPLIPDIINISTPPHESENLPNFLIVTNNQFFSHSFFSVVFSVWYWSFALSFLFIPSLCIFCLTFFSLSLSWRGGGVGVGEERVIFLFCSFCLHPWHMEGSGPGTESQPQLPPLPQLQQCWILPLQHLSGTLVVFWGGGCCQWHETHLQAFFTLPGGKKNCPQSCRSAAESLFLTLSRGFSICFS